MKPSSSPSAIDSRDPGVVVAHPALIAPTEWRFVLWVIAIVLVLTTIPYVYASLSAPAERRFVGFILNTSDHAQYLSWYKAFQSEPLISNLQTSEPNPPIFFNLLWWGLAQLGKITGLGYSQVYQIFRWAAGAFFLSMTYSFTALFFREAHVRRLAFSIVAFGAGLGWILVALKYLLGQPDVMFPLDVYVSEGNSFLCILGYPHFAEAACLILAVIGLLLYGERSGQLRYAVYAGLTALFLGLQHGYDLIIVWAVPTAYGALVFWRTRRWPVYWFKAMLITGLISWPPALYSVLLTRLNPIWKEVLAQFANAGVYTPDPLHMLILMGAPLILALASAGWLLWRGLRHKQAEALAPANLFLIVWLFVGWALTYIPADFQIHMISSWQVPVAFLATIGLVAAAPALQRRWPTLHAALSPTRLGLALVVFVALTNVYLYFWRFIDLHRYEYPYFLHQSEFEAMDWLEQNTRPGAVVFSSYDVGRYVPGLSGRVAFLSHWAQTVDFFTKRDLVSAFYAGTLTTEQRQQVLQHYGVAYVLYGPAEQALGSAGLEQEAFLESVYTNSEVQIYQYLP